MARKRDECDLPGGRRHGRRRVLAVCRRLRGCYGPVQPPPQGPLLDELIATILSQNTADKTSGPAFDELRRRFGSWEAVREAPVSRIAAAIRRAGLARVKAPRIKAILERLHAERGELSLEFLRRWPVPAAMDYLARFPGVGPKTAACVLLFACGQPVLPVDTHVHRVSRRLGLIGPRVTAAAAHQVLGQLAPREKVLEFHIQLIRHGRICCRARWPQCSRCALRDMCPFGISGRGGPAAPGEEWK